MKHTSPLREDQKSPLKYRLPSALTMGSLSRTYVGSLVVRPAYTDCGSRSTATLEIEELVATAAPKLELSVAAGFPPSLFTSPSSLLIRSVNSALRALDPPCLPRGRRRFGGKMQSILERRHPEHGCVLSHLILRWRQLVQLSDFDCESAGDGMIMCFSAYRFKAAATAYRCLSAACM